MSFRELLHYCCFSCVQWALSKVEQDERFFLYKAGKNEPQIKPGPMQRWFAFSLMCTQWWCIFQKALNVPISPDSAMICLWKTRCLDLFGLTHLVTRVTEKCLWLIYTLGIQLLQAAHWWAQSHCFDWSSSEGGVLQGSHFQPDEFQECSVFACVAKSDWQS